MKSIRLAVLVVWILFLALSPVWSQNQNVQVQFGIQINGKPAESFNPTSLTFPNTNVNVSSSPLTITMTNTGTATLTITAVSVPAPYSQTNNCTPGLAPNASCTINVTFTPTATGTFNNNVTVTDNDPAGGTQTVPVSGQGVTSGTCAGNIPCATGWYQVPNSSLSSLCPTYPEIQGQTGCPAITSAWSGGTRDNRRNRHIVKGGGHNDYYGNEIYALDYNHATAPGIVLVHDATHNPNLGTIGGATETYADGSPSARHTYNGLLYLNDQDKYWMFGAGIPNNGNFSNFQYWYDPTTTSGTGWTTLGSGGPNPGEDGSVPTWATDPLTELIWGIQPNSGDFWSYAPLTNTWTNNGSPGGCTSDNNGAALDYLSGYFVCGGGGGTAVRIQTVSPFTSTDITNVGSCETLWGTDGPGLAFYRPKEVFVGYVGGNTVYVYDPVANTCTTQTFTGGPTTVQANGTFGRWDYLEGLGAFSYQGSMSTNAFTLRMDSPSTLAEADFTKRCSQPGVIVCDTFDSAAVMPQNTCASSASGLYVDCFDHTSTYMTLDTTTYRSGGGSMLATIPGTAGSDPTGYWRRLITSSLSTTPGANDGNLTHFGNNSDLYFSYAQKMDNAYITNQWPQQGGGLTYFKQHIASWAGSTCGQVELTVVNDFNEGFPLMYTACGDDPFQDTFGGILYNEFDQNLATSTTKGKNGYKCPYQTPQPNAGCFSYSRYVNQWVTYYVHVHIGTFNSANSTIEAFVSTQEEPGWREWLYQTNQTLQLDAGNTWGYDMITLIAYWTDRDNTVSAGPTAHTWYDELIVSSKPIAAPATPPAAP